MALKERKNVNEPWSPSFKALTLEEVNVLADVRRRDAEEEEAEARRERRITDEDMILFL